MTREQKAMDKQPLLRVKNLNKHFSVGSKLLTAVSDVSFSINEGETLGLVGESGCGKSTIGKLILQLLEPTSGEIYFQDENITNCDQKRLKTLRRDLQIIFQDPITSLNPRMTIGEIIKEPLEIHQLYDKITREKKSRELLEMVGLPSFAINRYPHEFSGGQRQRIGIARALALKPKLIICDEPISALDVSIQAQIVNLLQSLQKEMKLTYLFIAHDLAIVQYISTRVAVMYLGKIVEISTKEELYKNPIHPYTQALLSAVPIPNPILERKRTRIILKGDPPSPLKPPKGCLFCNRCPKAMPICSAVAPELKRASENRFVACHLLDTK